MKFFDNEKGYRTVCLHNKGKKTNFYLHRLVALHYIPNPENKPTVDHINRIKNDNDVKNLRWATMTEQNFNKDVRNDNISGYRFIGYRKGIWTYQNRKYKIYKRFKNKIDAICFKFVSELKIKSQNKNIT